MKKLLNKLFYWLKNLFSTSKYKLKNVKEEPFKMKKNVIYIEGNKLNNDYWYAHLICPCGCDENITLNLIDDTSPCWKVTARNNKVSIYPSIWRTVNCKSHFWIKNGSIIWCKEKAPE